jgi:hypothetical protein
MSIEIISYRQSHETEWEEFCSEAVNATFLHTRRFLSYHGERFEDRSLLIKDEGKLVGLFPAALSLSDSTCVVSHSGITYGGVLHQGGLRGERMIMAFDGICLHYAAQGCTKLIYKAVPTFYHQASAQDDLYALFRLGARRTRCDLSSTIDLHHRLSVSERRRRSLKKAVKAGVSVIEGNKYIPALWSVLTDNLERKHGQSPVHNLDEITLLAERFPSNIQCVCGIVDNIVVAGTLLFITPTTYHAQYIASSELGYNVSALDAIFEHCIDIAQNDGRRWFDFGISTENAGLTLNNGLYCFKSEFGGGGSVHEFFELDLHK